MMSAPLAIDPAHSAVLSMDFSTAIVSIYAPDAQDLLARAASVLKQARSTGMTVIHVRVGFRPGLPEISPRNTLFSALKNSVKHQQLFEGAEGEIHPAVAPEADDISVIKHRVSAFAGTDLDMILRAEDIDTLILLGIATSGVVLSTVRHAADADYRLVVIKDCCADLDAEVHACLVNKVFTRQATVMSASEFLEGLKSPQPSVEQ
jgi:nicotinamidase-related amidase